MDNTVKSSIDGLIGATKDEIKACYGEPAFESSGFSMYLKENCKLYLKWIHLNGETAERASGAAFFDGDGECLLSRGLIPLTEQEADSVKTGEPDEQTLNLDAVLEVSGSGVRSTLYLIENGKVLVVSVIRGEIVKISQIDPANLPQKD